MPKHLRRRARHGYRGPFGRARFDFDVDMLLMSTFQVRDLPDDVVERIFDRAQREAGFRLGVWKQVRRYQIAAGRFGT